MCRLNFPGSSILGVKAFPNKKKNKENKSYKFPNSSKNCSGEMFSGLAFSSIPNFANLSAQFISEKVFFNVDKAIFRL